MRISCFALLFAIACGSAASADIITVDDDLADLPTADFTSIQAAVNAAVNGDEIVVYPGTYAEPIDMMGKLVTVRSTDPSDEAVVAATVIEVTFASRGFLLENGETSETVIDGFSFDSTAGLDPVLISGSGGIIRRCLFSGPGTSNELAIVCRAGAADVVIDACRFVGVVGSNSSTRVVSVFDSQVLVTGCEFTGGDTAILANGADLVIDSCVFVGNEGNGRGIVTAIISSEVQITDSVFAGNHALRTIEGTSRGGAVFMEDSSGLIERCQFFANEARAASNQDAEGGAVFAGFSSSVDILDSVFVGNEARYPLDGIARGGAIWLGNSPSRVIGCTIQNNGAHVEQGGGTTDGGGIWLANAGHLIANCIVRGNQRSFDSAPNANQISGSPFTNIANRISGAPGYIRSPDDGGDGWGDKLSTGGQNEGENDDFGDLRLLIDSAAVNRGDDTRVLSSMDIVGNPRVAGFRVDQGAYESGFPDPDAYFVDHTATGTGDGSSWADAATDLAPLFDNLVQGEIRVAEGTYIVDADGIDLTYETTILGGYPSGGGTRNPDAFETVISADTLGDDQPGGVNRGDNAARVFRAANTWDITLDGVTITGGNAAGKGAGVRLTGSTGVLIHDCIIEDNDSGDRGGGIAATASVFTVTDSVVRDNRAAGGGGLRLDGASEATFEHTDFIANTSSGASGALAINETSTATFADSLFEMNAAGGNGGVTNVNDASMADFVRCIFRGNQAGNATSTLRYVNGGGGTITDSLFHDNSADFTGTIRLTGGGSLSIVNSTIVNNHATNESGGVSLADSSPLTVTNSIIAFNTVANGSPTVQDQQVLGSIEVNYSLVEGWDGTLTGTGSIDGDPAFVDAMNDDYRIGAGSAAIDAGDTSIVVATDDLNGDPRVLDDTGTPDTGIGGPPVVDMGAYEFQGTTVDCHGDIADDFGFIGPDGMVSFGDFLALLGLIGPCPGGTPGCTGDIADDFGFIGPDGMVSFGDFLALLGLIGPCP